MTASLFGTSGVPQVFANGTLVPQSFTGLAGQTLFTLSAFSYVPGTNSLLVFINGQRQVVGRDFAETSSTSFTLTEGVQLGDYVDVIGFPAAVLSTVPIGQTGTATFAAATSVVVSFGTPQPDTSYKISLGAGANKTFWWTNKTVNGFTLNASAVSSDSVDWHIGR